MRSRSTTTAVYHIWPDAAGSLSFLRLKQQPQPPNGDLDPFFNALVSLKRRHAVLGQCA